jgi:low affinity Fe/Cu permease
MLKTPRAPALERFARRAAMWAGSSAAFGLALGVTLAWLALGPLAGWSDSWQLWMNTVTTIVTFLMVFLIQRSQNKDAAAMHLKLNEAVAALAGASNRLLNVEDLSEADLMTLHRHYARLAELAAHEASLTQSHSIEEAEARHKVRAPIRETGGGQAPGGSR